MSEEKYNKDHTFSESERERKEAIPSVEEKGERKEYGTAAEVTREIPREELPPEERMASSAAPPVSDEAEQESKKIKNLPRDRQIQALIDLAFQKGLRHSIDTARALKNPYILDAFHDTLTDHLYRELVESGKLKEL